MHSTGFLDTACADLVTWDCIFKINISPKWRQIDTQISMRNGHNCGSFTLLNTGYSSPFNDLDGQPEVISQPL